jgi:folate-binding protein YgfZ
VASIEDRFLLLQAPDQPDPADRILSPYVLSSDVVLEDASDRLTAFAVLGAADLGDASWWSPSVLGAGAGAVAPTGEPADRLRAALRAEDLEEVSADAVERWRIHRGWPRMGPDFGTDALPAEAGLEGTIDFTKGCFLGQESVAKVRNLGHPPRAILPVRSRAPIGIGMPVLAGSERVGEVTSVAGDGESDAIVRIRWAAASRDLSTPAGPLILR